MGVLELKSRVSAGLPSFQRFWGESISLPPPFLQATYILWLMAPSSIFRAHHSNLFFVITSPFSLTLEYFGPTWVIQGNLPISRSLT